MNAGRPVILIVDDTPDNIMLLAALLKEHYDTKVATSGAAALRILGAGGVAHPVALHLTWAHPDDLPRLRQAAALPADVRLEEERDEATF